MTIRNEYFSKIITSLKFGAKIFGIRKLFRGVDQRAQGSTLVTVTSLRGRSGSLYASMTGIPERGGVRYHL